MLEKLIEIRDELLVREGRAFNRANRKRENGNIEEAHTQDGKFIAYRTAREMLDELIEQATGEADEYEEPYDPFDEVGYDPYTGGFDMDL